MSKIHYLKTWPEYFQAVKEGKKTFEIRKNDRDFHAGDTLVLQEYDPSLKIYTGSEIVVTVTYTLDKPPFVPEGYVCMAIRDGSEMTTQKFPMISDKSSGDILPVISIKYENTEIVEVEVWMDNDIFTLEKGEFEVIER